MTLRFHIVTDRMAISKGKRKKDSNAGKNVREMNLYPSQAEMHHHQRHNFPMSLLYHSWVHSQRNLSQCPIEMHVHIYCDQGEEAAQRPTSAQRKNKVAFTRNRVLFSLKKEWTFWKMGRSGDHHVKQKKLFLRSKYHTFSLTCGIYM